MPKSVGFCMAAAAAIIAYIMITLTAMTPIASTMWMGFLPMICYFCTGAHKDWKLVGKMFIAYVCGLAWGQLVNLLWVYMFPSNMFIEGIIENGVLIFVMITVHVVYGGKTKFGFMPCVYLGWCLTTVGFGRPFPYDGLGAFGDVSAITGVGILLFYFAFGIIFAMGVEYLTGFFAKVFLKNKNPETKDEIVPETTAG